MGEPTARAAVHRANLLLLDGFEDWERRRMLSPTTIKTRGGTLRRYFRGIDKPALEATTADIEAWLDSRGGKAGLAPQTREAQTRVLRAFYRWAIREDLLTKDPTDDVVRPRLPRPLPRPMDPDDLVRAIEAADDRKAAMLTLAAYAGLRCQEIAFLRIEEVDFVAKRILVVNGKGDKERVVPMHPEVALRLGRIAPRSGYVFHRLHPLSAEPIKADTVSSFLSHLFRDLGIQASAHMGRHLFLTTVYEASQDIRVTQELAGHASPVTTSRYAAWSNARASDAVAAIAYGEKA